MISQFEFLVNISVLVYSILFTSLMSKTSIQLPMLFPIKIYPWYINSVQPNVLANTNCLLQLLKIHSITNM